MASLEIDFEAKCGICGKSLEVTAHNAKKYTAAYIELSPCAKCIADAVESARID